MIEYIDNVETKREITQRILNELPIWFGLEESVNEYVKNISECTFIVYKDSENNGLGFYALKPTSEIVLEIYVCGVVESSHRKGIGKAMFEETVRFARKFNYKYIQVKTVESGYYDSYDKTNLYYTSLGFEKFEVIANLWDKHNPCQIYIFDLRVIR